MKMTAKRRSEIDRMLVKETVRREGIENLMKALQNLDQLSNKIKVPVPELKIYGEDLLHDLVEDHFAEEVK